MLFIISLSCNVLFMIKKLAYNQRKKLMQKHRLERDHCLADRIKTILLLDDGLSYSHIAKVLFLDDQTIRNYEKTYSQYGISKLLKTSYKGGESKLSPKQEAELKDHVEKKTYHSAAAIAHYVENAYEISYSVKGMVHLLNRLGFTYKKTRLIPGKADAKKQREFVREYQELKANKGKKDEILFMDGTHPHHNPLASYAWILKGKEKEIPSNTGRKRINLNGAINIDNYEVTIRDDEWINAQSTVELFKQIEAKYPNAEIIHIIADNAKYYHCELVENHLKNSSINLISLPSYSPNLNLIERLWKFYKKEILYDTYYETFAKFKRATKQFFENIEEYKEKLQSLLTEKFQIIGA